MGLDGLEILAFGFTIHIQVIPAQGIPRVYEALSHPLGHILKDKVLCFQECSFI